MGGKKDTVFGSPLTLDVTIEALSPDSLLSTSRGVALVRSQGVDIAIINSRRSFTTLQDFEEIGLDPLSFKIVVVKLGYLYPELRDIAPAHLMALTSGFCNLDIPSLPFTQVQRPVYPLDLDMEWKAFFNLPNLPCPGFCIRLLLPNARAVSVRSPQDRRWCVKLLRYGRRRVPRG